MTISANDMIRAMRENPEARDALRREILTEEILTMPQRIADLVAVVTRQGQDVEVLKEDVGVLKEDVGVLKEDVGVLKEDVGVLKEDMSSVKEDVRVLNIDMGKVKGMSLEATLQGRILPFLSSRLDLRRGVVVRGPMLSAVAHAFEDEIEDASDRGNISRNQRERIYLTDLIVRARSRANGKTVYVAVEASFTIDGDDIDRASKTADGLRQVFPGVEVVPAVYGSSITREDAALADQTGVRVFLGE